MTILLADLVSGAQELADMVGDPHVTTAQWRLWVNEGLRELHGIVSTAFEDSFFSTSDFTLTSTALGVKTLPTDFLRIRGLDRDPDTQSVRCIHRFNFGERNRIGRRYDFRWDDWLRYRVVSRTTMYLRPVERAPGNYRLYYVKRPILLTTTTPGTTDKLQDELDEYSEYIKIVTAIKGVDKQERDSTALRASRDLMRADIIGGARTDENEADTVTDIEDGWLYWPGGTTSGSGGGGGGGGG